MNFRRRVTHGVVAGEPLTRESPGTAPILSDAERQRPAEERAATYARLLEEVLRIVPARLEESQLPLHILLDSPFGELNENQEELLGAAHNAIQAADIEVRLLRKLLDLERGRVSFVKQPMGVAELLRAPLAIAAARAEKAGVSHRWSVPIELPRVFVDPTHMPEALTSVLGLAIGRTPSGGGALLVEARETENGDRVSISITHGNGAHADGTNDVTADGLLARRTIELQGGTIAEGAQRTLIELPAERLGTPSYGARTSGPRE